MILTFAVPGADLDVRERGETASRAEGTPRVDEARQDAARAADARRAGLMAAAQGGDRAAYDSLLRECLPVVAMIARGRGVPPDSIDDVVQETLVTLHRARHTYDPSRSFMAWLRTIADRRAIDALRGQGRRRAREVHDPVAYDAHVDPAPDATQNVDRRDKDRRLHAAIVTLPDGQRQAVEQLSLHGRSLAEASVVTGRTTGALKVNLHRALRSLQARLKGEEQRND